MAGFYAPCSSIDALQACPPWTTASSCFFCCPCAACYPWPCMHSTFVPALPKYDIRKAGTQCIYCPATHLKPHEMSHPTSPSHAQCHSKHNHHPDHGCQASLQHQHLHASRQPWPIVEEAQGVASVWQITATPPSDHLRLSGGGTTTSKLKPAGQT